MNYEVEVTEQAESDLRGIFDHIAFSLQSLQNAVGQLDRLEKAISGLSYMPERFRAYDNEPWHSRGLRIMPVDNYCVFYIPDNKEQVVTIIRVMYGSRDVNSQLNNSTND